jgi:tetrahydromethanopterin:alpha-L-glutamate ligase
MTRIAIMTDETGWHTRQLQAALRARGAVGRCIDLADCHIATTHAWHGLAIPGFGRELPDAALVRGVAGGSFEQVTKRLGVLHALRELGVPVYNDARAIERSVDKSMTSLLLHAAAIPTPPTWATESTADARRIAMREGAAGHALVLKPLFGSQGKGLQLVGNVAGVHHAIPAACSNRLVIDLSTLRSIARASL